MGAKKLDIQKYHTAILLIKKMAKNREGVKRIEFAQQYEIAPITFKIMEELNIIKEEFSTHKEGSIFSWVYNQASNETDSKIAVIVTDKIHENNQKYYKKYKDPSWNKKNDKIIIEKVISKKPIAVSELSEEKILLVKPEEKIPMVIPEQKVPLVKPEEKTPMVIPEQKVPLVKPEENDKKQIKQINFSFTGNLSKKEILDRIETLIEDKKISSFKIELLYK